MKLKHFLLATTLAAGLSSAWAAPTLQTCAPLEVNHNGGTGLSYVLACEAGDWRLHYSGSVPAGDDTVNAQYRLNVAGPAGASFVQNRVVRLPSPSRLGQMLSREAVLLDNGDLALRDCKEIGCSQYRPLNSPSNVASTSVTLMSEAKRLQDDQKRLLQEIERLKKDGTTALAKADREKAAAVRAERESAAAELDRVKAEFADVEAKVAAQVKVELAEATRKLEAERRGALNAIQAERDQVARRVQQLEGESSLLSDELAKLERERNQAREAEINALSDLETARKTLDQAMKLPLAQKAAYDFALADVVAQHNEQLALLQRAMPGTSFKGILEDIQIPKVNVDAKLNSVNIAVPESAKPPRKAPAAKATSAEKPVKAAHRTPVAQAGVTEKTAKPAKTSAMLVPLPKQ